MCCGERFATATSFVARSAATTVISVPQKRGALGLALSIFFALLALDAIPGMWQRIETLEADLSPAVVTLAELLRIPIKPAQRFVDVPEKTTLLAREQKRLFALHRVGALIGHVEGVCAQIAVRALRRRSESLVVVPQLLEHALPLFEQALLKMLKVFLRHCLRFFAAFGASCFCCHFLTDPLQGDFNVLPIKVKRVRRVCAFNPLTHRHPESEYLVGNPLLKCLDCFLNFRRTSDGERDTITYGETQFLPQPLNTAHQLSREPFQPQLSRHHRVESGEISALLLYHQLAGRASHHSQVFRA